MQRGLADLCLVGADRVAADGRLEEVRITPENSPARNDAFDVTPARLVTALITEAGAVEASAEGLAAIRDTR